MCSNGTHILKYLLHNLEQMTRIYKSYHNTLSSLSILALTKIYTGMSWTHHNTAQKVYTSFVRCVSWFILCVVIMAQY